MREKAAKLKWEGVMLRMNTIYEGKRTNNLLKYKHGTSPITLIEACLG